MSDWLSWQELNSMGFKDFQILNSIKMGRLTPYSEYTLNKINCPNEYHLYYCIMDRFAKISNELMKLEESRHPKKEEDERILKKTSGDLKSEAKIIYENDPKCTSWEYLISLDTDKEIEKLISDSNLKKANFKREDVEGLNKDILKKKRANEIDRIIWHTGAEGEKLYEDILDRVKELGQTIANVSSEELRDTAISAFKEKKRSFNFIKEKYVECPESYRYVEKQRRKLIGSWIQKELKRHELKCSGGYGGAYDRYNKLKTKKLPTN